MHFFVENVVLLRTQSLLERSDFASEARRNVIRTMQGEPLLKVTVATFFSHDLNLLLDTRKKHM